MAFKGMSITYSGRNLLNQSQASKIFHIKCIRIGDGKYSGDFHEVKNVINAIYDVEAEVHHEGNNLFIDADINSNDHSNYYLREIALIAQDSEGNEVVYAYDNAGDDAEFISPDGNIAYENRLRFCFTITDDVVVTIEMNGNAYALANDLNQLISRVTSLERNGVQVADTLPIGSTVFWDDRNQLPDAWEYVDYNICPKQILINNDFQCWQRGESFDYSNSQISKNTYLPDMWAIGNGSKNFIISKANNGCHLELKAENSYLDLRQVVYGYQAGDTVTMSIKITNSESFTMLQRIGNDGTTNKNIDVLEGEHIYNLTYTLKDSDMRSDGGFYIFPLLGYANKTFDIVINYVDLFEGNITYPHVKEDYAITELKCSKKLKYIQPNDNAASINIGTTYVNNYTTSATRYRVYFAMNAELDSIPTITYDDLRIYFYNGRSYKVDICNFYNMANGVINVTMEFNINDGFSPIDKPCAVYVYGYLSATCEPV